MDLCLPLRRLQMLQSMVRLTIVSGNVETLLLHMHVDRSPLVLELVSDIVPCMELVQHQRDEYREAISNSEDVTLHACQDQSLGLPKLVFVETMSWGICDMHY